VNPELVLQQVFFLQLDPIAADSSHLSETNLAMAEVAGSTAPLIEAAKAISDHMDPDQNRSKTFQVFRDGLREMVRY